MSSHLRSNLVAYVALVVSLLTALGGTAYAAGIPDGSVTTRKLATGAVTSPKIADRTIAPVDIQRGVIPADGYMFQGMLNPKNPAEVNEGTLGGQVFVLPRAGRAHVRFHSNGASVLCSAGAPRVGIYVDGIPVRGTRYDDLQSDSQPLELVGSVELRAGRHRAAFGYDCPTGLVDAAGIRNATWTVVLVAK